MKFLFSMTALSVLMVLPCHGRAPALGHFPNSSVAECGNCHKNPTSPSSALTPFGQAVDSATGGNSTSGLFWNAAFAALDSDGDGISNGTELRDPDGDGTPINAVGVTNPGNRPPTFTNTGVATATMGVPYLYTATAADLELNTRIFTKVSGPSWITVTTLSNSGKITGTPPSGSSGPQSVTIRVADIGNTSNGYSLGHNDLTYTLTVGSSFAGWQNLNFTLPAEAALAAETADPDGDGLENRTEYALGLPPRVSSRSNFINPALTAGGLLRLSLLVRDDDAKLSVNLETASDVTFGSLTSLSPLITDPVPGDGFKTWEFTDSVAAQRRFGRIKVAILP